MSRRATMPCRTRLSLVSHPQSILGTCRTSPSASLYVRKVCTAHRLYPNSTHDVDTNLRRAHTSGAIGLPDSILNLMPLSSRSARGALRHQSCSWPEMLRIMKSSAAMPRGRRLPPGGALRPAPDTADQRSAAREQRGGYRSPHGFEGEGGRLTVHAAYHRVYLKEKVPVEPKSLAQFEGHRAHCTWQAGGVLSTCCELSWSVCTAHGSVVSIHPARVLGPECTTLPACTAMGSNQVGDW